MITNNWLVMNYVVNIIGLEWLQVCSSNLDWIYEWKYGSHGE